MPDSKADLYLWLRPERPPRDAQTPLTRGQIAAAAITLADERGAEAVTMRGVASRLGCGTMSLYRHVRNKDELIEVMIDTIVGEDDGALPPDPRGDWRSALRDHARRSRRQVLRHPWVAQLLPAHPVFGPNMLASIERVLTAVDGLGLSIDDMAGVVRTVESFVRGFSQNELAEREWRHPQLPLPGWAASMLPYLEQVAATGKYPLFTRMIVEAEDFPDPGKVFEWQLDRVLDGLAAAIPAPAALPPQQQQATTGSHAGRKA
jgi:AcrR family transcriptional regulator